MKKKMQKKIRIIYTYLPDLKSAKKISTRLVKEKKVICANCIDKVNSFYLWKNKFESSKETLVLLKVRVDLSKQVQKEILNLHPYETPFIAELPLNSVNLSYLDYAFLD